MHDWSILSTPSDMILDRVRRREIVSGVFIIEINNARDVEIRTGGGG